MRDSGLAGIVRRLNSGLGCTARGGAGAWAVVLLLAVLQAAATPSPATCLMLVGSAVILPFAWTIALGFALALLARPRQRVPVPVRSTTAPGARWLVLLALEAGIAVAAAWFLAGPLEPLVPRELAYRPLIARLGAAHLGVALGVLAGAAFWRRACGAWAGFPLWSAIPMHFFARLSTQDEVALVSPGRDALLDLGTAAFCVIAGARWSAVRDGFTPPRSATLILGAMIAALGGVAIVGALRPSASARLVAEFPGPGASFAHVRSFYDLDGDGFAGVLGGPDCDDADVLVGPMALEIVGNGIDDNCMGGDLAAVRPTQAVRRAASAPRHDVIVVVVDTLRSDALAHERRPPPMPRTEALARHGAVFRRAYAHAPYTGLALRSLHTGEYPMNMSAFEVGLGMGPTLAERLSAQGYQTSAIVQFDEVSRRTAQATQDSNLFRGFSRVDWSLRELNRDFRAVTSPATTDRALAELSRLRAAGRPFFLWLHYFDPHAEYQPHAGTPFDGSTLAGRYWQEVYATDRELGRLYVELESSDFFDRGYLFLTGDHGELLGEGGRFQHALWLDDLALRVPLVVRGPGVPSGRFDTRVRHVDVAPTLLDLAAGIRAPLPGRHLAEVWSGAQRADRDVVAVTTYNRRVIKRAFLRASYELTVDVLAGSKSLYVSTGSPERTNLIDRQPGTARDLEAALGRVWDEAMNDHVLARRRAVVR